MALAGLLALWAHHPARLLQPLRPLMAYSDVAELAADDDLRQRLYACLATLGWDNGSIWVDRQAWRIVAGNPGWANAWASAGASGVQRRGWDSGVITDDMIRERVFAVRDEKGDI